MGIEFKMNGEWFPETPETFAELQALADDEPEIWEAICDPGQNDWCFFLEQLKMSGGTKRCELLSRAYSETQGKNKQLLQRVLRIDGLDIESSSTSDLINQDIERIKKARYKRLMAELESQLCQIESFAKEVFMESLEKAFSSDLMTKSFIHEVRVAMVPKMADMILSEVRGEYVSGKLHQILMELMKYNIYFWGRGFEALPEAVSESTKQKVAMILPYVTIPMRETRYWVLYTVGGIFEEKYKEACENVCGKFNRICSNFVGEVKEDNNGSVVSIPIDVKDEAMSTFSMPIVPMDFSLPFGSTIFDQGILAINREISRMTSAFIATRLLPDLFLKSIMKVCNVEFVLELLLAPDKNAAESAAARRIIAEFTSNIHSEIIARTDDFFNSVKKKVDGKINELIVSPTVKLLETKILNGLLSMTNKFKTDFGEMLLKQMNISPSVLQGDQNEVLSTDTKCG